MSRRFLLVAHTGRADAIRALLDVMDRLVARDLVPVLLDFQVADMVAASPEWLGIPSVTLDDLTRRGAEVLPPAHAAKDLELAIVLGGDGTILRAIEIVRDNHTPVHGVNLGHVGFLAESEPEDLDHTVQRLMDGDYVVEERLTLQVDVYRGEELLASTWALNEAALEKADREKMINVVVEIDQRPVSAFGADGVLLATPTGSTAYAFSAGGPVVWPEVEAMLMVPLSAHALFARPIMYGPTSTAAVEIMEDPHINAVLWCDGRRDINVQPGCRVEAKRSPNPVRLARLFDVPFTDRLVSKFHLPVEGWRGRDSLGKS